MLVYEMVAGYPPFQQEDRVAMFRAICATQFTTPSHFSKARGQRPLAASSGAAVTLLRARSGNPS